MNAVLEMYKRVPEIEQALRSHNFMYDSEAVKAQLCNKKVSISLTSTVRTSFEDPLIKENYGIPNNYLNNVISKTIMSGNIPSYKYNHYFTKCIAGYGLFSLTFQVEFVSSITSMPRVALGSVHHRFSKIDVLTQFLFGLFYDNVKVAVAIFKKFYALTVLYFVLFDAFLLHSYHKESKVRHDHKSWLVVHELLQAVNKKTESTILNIFSDRDGCLYSGHEEYWFKHGMFAASLYTGLPILDLLISEPTASNETLHIELVQWTPKALGSQHQSRCAKCTDSNQLQSDCIDCITQFATWKRLNRDQIRMYTLECEADYKARTKIFESCKTSCETIQTSFCAVNQGPNTRVMKNLVKFRENFTFLED